ncbi:DUF4397 domain-containing protein [Nocardioides speluncae]|uniref:DUF4397 domain-containing protein n=1 Tax=Nocardioides speluncae TaxID=2670337 RepID=UPI000D68EF65|nr:DUF4397 domain-containing protein [Nocardioides speluncae]
MSHTLIKRGVAALTGAAAVLFVVPVGGAEARAETATVYVVQGVAGETVSIAVDGKAVDDAAAAKTIVGPLALTPGEHTLTVDGEGDTLDVEASFDVAAGASVDAVIHRQVDPTAAPIVTTYDNDLSKVAKGSGRVAVAHVAAVGPADVRVQGEVLFANIANGEVLTLTVPAKTYPVEIVPAATDGPSVLGPVDLPVAKSALTRVFAIGVAAEGTMDAIVQVLPLGVRGSGKSPTLIDAGSGGQAAELGLTEPSQGDSGLPPYLGVAALLAISAVIVIRRPARR